ncbi:hypothetical protein CPA58_29610, partial [Klebsiella pneumoniae]
DHLLGFAAELNATSSISAGPAGEEADHVFLGAGVDDFKHDHLLGFAAELNATSSISAGPAGEEADHVFLGAG